MMATGSHKRRLAVLAAISAASAIVELRPAHAGCTMDVECKGVRICENGRCVYPPPEGTTQGPTETALPQATAAPSSLDAAPVPPAAPVAAPVPRLNEAGPGANRVAPKEFWVRRPNQGFTVEVGGFGFGIYDGKAGALGGGIEGGYRLSRWLTVAAWFEGSGAREQELAHSSATYRRYDLGLGLAVGKTVEPFFADLSLLPELTRLTVEGAEISSGHSENQWLIAAGARIRAGLLIGPWCPFMFVAGSRDLAKEQFKFDGSHGYDILTIPRGNASYGLGLAYFFGAANSDENDRTIPGRPRP
jgi:hypothetical protein